MKAVRYSKQAIKSLKKMPCNDSVRVRAKIEEYASNPKAQLNNVKKLTGLDNLYRLRVGNYRVVFTETNVILSVEKIAPRGSVY